MNQLTRANIWEGNVIDIKGISRIVMAHDTLGTKTLVLGTRSCKCLI